MVEVSLSTQILYEFLLQCLFFILSLVVLYIPTYTLAYCIGFLFRHAK